jgi:hypothetical protein
MTVHTPAMAWLRALHRAVMVWLMPRDTAEKAPRNRCRACGTRSADTVCNACAHEDGW